ncbi:hypothetical protein CRG98_029645 [Punica granatum]|uniref:Uncharacterized protein n=1 Tax=Punica granatum TaxID=22663 RepID=A0A2I0J153_PUNGR|nr:hypothetical protein CRG98_029645 [Punica granatum]
MSRLGDVGDSLADNEWEEDGDEGGLDEVGAESVEVPTEGLRLGRLLLHGGVVPVRVPRPLYLLAGAVDVRRRSYDLPYGRRPGAAVMRRGSHEGLCVSERSRAALAGGSTVAPFCSRGREGRGGERRELTTGRCGYGDRGTERNRG